MQKEAVSTWAKWGIGFGLILVTTGVVVTLLLGYRPAPQRIMKPSFFDHPEEIGAVTLKRFYASMSQEPIVVLGVPANRDWSPGFLKGFIEAAKSNNREFKVVTMEKRLPDSIRMQVSSLISENSEIETNSESMSELSDVILKEKAAGRQLLIIVPNVYATRLLPSAPLGRLEKALVTPGTDARPFFTISLGPLALDPSQEKDLDPACMGSERDGAGTSEFGCVIAQAGRGYYRNHVFEKDPGAKSRFVAIMQSTKANDYLLLVRAPEVSK